MRILFVGGMYRGYRLAQRLIERGEEVVGALVFEEDTHETPKYCERILELFAAHGVWCKKTRRIAESQVADIAGRLAPDVILCLGWRTLIPAALLTAVPRGGIAVHDSLLPRLRGFAPTNWGLILGHDRLGATLFQLTDDVDQGEVYFQQTFEPEAHEPFASIQEKIATVSVALFDQYLDAACAGTLNPWRQREDEATYTCARCPADGEIDWRASSEQIERLIRALGDPGPGAFTYYRGQPLTIVSAEALRNPRRYEGHIPGRIVDRAVEAGTVDVLCGEGVLRIARVRRSPGDVESSSTVLPSVRESLGMNHSGEIAALRERVEELERCLRGCQVG